MWALVAGLEAASAAPTAADLAGTWSGALEVGPARLPLVLHLAALGDRLTGTLDSPDQGARGLALASIVLDGASLSFTVPQVGGAWSGVYDGSGALAGTWSQGGSLPLAFARGAPAAPRRRPQEPAPPFPYRERELAVDAVPGVRLAGTWTVPAGSGPFPAVVLVSGSGLQDRDEALFGHRPFAVLADALARAGIASYRYDDRGFGRSTGDPAAATTLDFAADAAAALRAARAQPEAGAVGVLGHSEGGLVAALVGGDADFVVLLAGPGLPGRGVVEGQVEALARAGGADASEAQRARAAQSRLLQVVLDGGDVEAALAAEGLPAEEIRAQARSVTSPWYRTFLTLDPAPALSALRVPVLALLGGKDLQVVARENGPALEAALQSVPGATVETFPGLNHLFQPAGTGLPGEYGAIETTLDPAVLDRITRWIGDVAR